MTPSPPSNDGPLTLGRILEIIADLVSPLTLPLGPDVRATGPLFHDAAEPSPIEPGSLVLAVGLAPSSGTATDVVRLAGAQGAAAVAFKPAPGEAVPESLLREADEAGVCVIAVHPDLAWGQLFVVLRNIAAPTGPHLEAGATSIPAGDLFALAHAIAAMVGGPVTIEDTRFNVLAYSRLDGPTDQLRLDAILQRRTDDVWLDRLAEAGVLPALWATAEPVHVEPLESWGLRSRMAIAVRAGNEVLGSIWVVEGAEPLRPAAADALREAAQIAALHMLRHRAADDLRREHRGQVLQAVLSGRGNASVLAETLGIDPEARYVVVAFGLPPAAEVDIAVKSERVLGLVSRYWEAYRRRAVCTSMARAVYTLLPVGPPSAAERLLTVTEDVVRHVASASSVDLCAGIGSEVPLGEVVTSRREADQVLQVIAEQARERRVADIASVRSQVFLMEIERLVAQTPELLVGKLSKLVEHDEKHDTSYVDTLEAYLRSFADVTAAADWVSVHSKTFRYRMRRVAELSGLDLTDPVERVVTQLQLRCRLR